MDMKGIFSRNSGNKIFFRHKIVVALKALGSATARDKLILTISEPFEWKNHSGFPLILQLQIQVPDYLNLHSLN